MRRDVRRQELHKSQSLSIAGRRSSPGCSEEPQVCLPVLEGLGVAGQIAGRSGIRNRRQEVLEDHDLVFIDRFRDPPSGLEAVVPLHIIVD